MNFKKKDIIWILGILMMFTSIIYSIYLRIAHNYMAQRQQWELFKGQYFSCLLVYATGTWITIKAGKQQL